MATNWKGGNNRALNLLVSRLSGPITDRAMRPTKTALSALVLAGALFSSGCATPPRIPFDVIDLAPGRTEKAFIQLSVKTYASKYMTEVWMLRDEQKLERVGVIGIGRRDAPEFFRDELQSKIMRITFAVPPGKSSFLLRSYDMPQDKPFQVDAEAGKITPVVLHKEATEVSYLNEPLSRRWKIEILPAVAVDP